MSEYCKQTNMITHPALSRNMRSLIESQTTGTFLKKDGLEALLWVLRQAEKLDRKAKS